MPFNWIKINKNKYIYMYIIEKWNMILILQIIFKNEYNICSIFFDCYVDIKWKYFTNFKSTCGQWKNNGTISWSIATWICLW